jgi:hypothetical protein
MDSNSVSDPVQQGYARQFVRWGRAAMRWAGLALVAASSGAVGCVAEVAPAPVAPLDYYYYPYTYYDGHVVYYVQGNWYYPYGDRWYYYRHVPPGLVYRRAPVYQYRPPYYYYRAPYARPPYYRVPRGYGGGPHR